MPVALVNADTPLNVSVCIADELDGSTQNTQHLLELGHERVVFFLGDQPPHYSVTQRVAGYEQTMARAGKSQHARVVTSTIQDFAAAIADQEPQQRPTAIILYTHFAAISLLRLFWERGIRVPDDISVATFSNSYPVAEVIPPLTTAALPTEEMGRAAAEMVLEQIRMSGEAEPRRVVLKETLIVRKSTAPVGGC
jgi:LacI family transcriptional regulator